MCVCAWCVGKREEMLWSSHAHRTTLPALASVKLTLDPTPRTAPATLPPAHEGERLVVAAAGGWQHRFKLWRKKIIPWGVKRVPDGCTGGGKYLHENYKKKESSKPEGKDAK